MAAVFTEVSDSQDVYGRTRRKVFDITLDTSYSTGGLAIAAAAVGLRVIQGGRIIGGNAAAKVLQYHIDTTTTPGAAKLIALFPTGSTLAAGTALADPILNAGGTAVTASAATGPFAAGQAKEVGATANLSTLIVRVEFFGN